LWKGVKASHVLVVPFPALALELQSDSLKLAFCAVAVGRRVVSRRDWHGNFPYKSRAAVGFKRAAVLRKVELHFTAELVARNRKLVALVKLVCGGIPDCQWSVVDRVGLATHTIGSLSEFRDFLAKERRVVGPRGLASSYFSPPDVVS
jgi:hypothetical protein